MAETISVFVPLLFLVVTELSSIAREIELKEMCGEEEAEPFILGLFPEFKEALGGLLTVPQLGHFNFIHGANFLLLALGMFLAVIVC